MVSVFEGQLCRTWNYLKDGKKHIINLYHDTITGVRSALLDYEEIPGSLGTSALIMESEGHKFHFEIKGEKCYLLIRRSGWLGFEYICFVGDQQLTEVTQTVSTNQNPIFKVDLLEYVSTPDEYSEQYIVWYVIETVRLEDGIKTVVHRRFKDFSELNSSIKQNLKGHHLRSSLPNLPEKQIKIMTDHQDPEFITERSQQLSQYLRDLVCVPHVCDMTVTKSFLGLMDQVQETSVLIPSVTVGITLVPSQRLGAPAIVGNVVSPDICRNVKSGDVISKINGVAVCGYTYDAVVARIQNLPRPVILHFAQAIQDKLTEGASISTNVTSSSTAAVTFAALDSALHEDDETATSSLVYNGKISPSHAKSKASVQKSGTEI